MIFGTDEIIGPLFLEDANKNVVMIINALYLVGSTRKNMIRNFNRTEPRHTQYVKTLSYCDLSLRVD